MHEMKIIQAVFQALVINNHKLCTAVHRPVALWGGRRSRRRRREEVIYIWLQLLLLPCWGDYTVLDTVYTQTIRFHSCECSLNIQSRDMWCSYQGVQSGEVVYAPAESSEASFPSLQLEEFSALWEPSGGNGKAYKHCVLLKAMWEYLVSMDLFSCPNHPPKNTVQLKVATTKRKRRPTHGNDGPWGWNSAAIKDWNDVFAWVYFAS